jgi:hypothetical protein
MPRQPEAFENELHEGRVGDLAKHTQAPAAASHASTSTSKDRRSSVAQSTRVVAA